MRRNRVNAESKGTTLTKTARNSGFASDETMFPLERFRAGGRAMVQVTYEIVEHDGGWAYKVNGAYSESYPTHAQALEAARIAAAEQMQPGHTEVIEYEDENGRWHVETAPGRDRPETAIKDKS